LQLFSQHKPSIVLVSHVPLLHHLLHHHFQKDQLHHHPLRLLVLVLGLFLQMQLLP
jgi:hypothetical protein